MSEPLIYLVGSVQGKGHESAYKWRSEATESLLRRGFGIINPLPWDARNFGEDTDATMNGFANLVTTMSENAVDRATALLCNVPFEGGWGTPIEVYRANTILRKPVFGFGIPGDEPISPWIYQNFSYITESMDEAIDIMSYLLLPTNVDISEKVFKL